MAHLCSLIKLPINSMVDSPVRYVNNHQRVIVVSNHTSHRTPRFQMQTSSEFVKSNANIPLNQFHLQNQLVTTIIANIWDIIYPPTPAAQGGAR